MFSLGGDHTLVSDYIIHPFFHLNWIQGRLSCFQIFLVDVLASICGLNALNEEAISVLVDVKELLVVV